MPEQVQRIMQFREFARRKPAVLVSAALAVGAIVWVGSGVIGSESAPPQSNGLETALGTAGTNTPTNLFAVRILNSEARQRTSKIIVNGRTEPFRTVEIRAETEGRILELNTYRGEEVVEGDIIAKIALYDREAKLAEATALLRQRQIEFNASASLVTEGFRSETQHAGAQAQLDAARAIVEQRRTDIERTNIRAPFSGMIHSGHMEIGDYVKSGNPVGTLLDLDPILIVGQATENEVASLSLNGTGGAELSNGQVLTGKVTYIAAQADSGTRTYRFELEVENPDYAIRAGLTARIFVDAGQNLAHLIPPSALTLSDVGEIGIKTVNADDRVEFFEIRILEETLDGMWIAGLPQTARIVVGGQEFVVVGEHVAVTDGARVLTEAQETAPLIAQENTSIESGEEPQQ